MSRQQVFDDPLSMFGGGASNNEEEPKREEPQPILEGAGSLFLSGNLREKKYG